MIRLSDISKAYGPQKVFDNFSLEIENGKILCVLGESGGGKTTLLNILAGLVPFSGTLYFLKIAPLLAEVTRSR